MRWCVASLMTLSFAVPAAGHRLDEYLQATAVTLSQHRLDAQLRLTPGVAVFPAVRALIDTDRDQVMSPVEQRAYAERVLADLSLAVDGERVPFSLKSFQFSGLDALQEGRGDIRLELSASLPGDRSSRRVLFKNGHQPRLSAYLVNCLVPQDPLIRVTAQQRNYEQSIYQLDYTQGPNARAVGLSGALAAGAILLLIGLAVRRRWL